ncbi:MULTISPECIES: two-component regulator propeller domain-containing protein [Thalassotalea]|uniref:Two-component regulator propeller domain-containing protein n=1 Tax=Thalassotalea castellviae TaxID=3075612 RepID=A0ABU3A3H6_9GAMM|nr:two-component regulator propeller domain-containing protein [Thalassotalea sp. W431]MDT0604443.1 two-component regulator propeller domain-containing protein [Thalassotalea sp. W431]
MKKTLFLFLFSFVIFKSMAQELNLLGSFPLDNPLSYQFVRAIAQDQHGFMWFGSQEGLHRFDGHNFVSYHHDASNPTSLGSDVISRLLVDRKNQLWVATRGGGLNLFDEKTNSFKLFTTNSVSAKLSHDNVNEILQDSQGKIWVGTEKGLNILNKVEGKWQNKVILQELGNEKSLSNNMIHALLETKQGTIWVGTNGGGISVFDLQGQFIKTIKYDNHQAIAKDGKLINSLFQDKQGYIWIGTVERGLIRFQPKLAAFKQYKFEPNNAFSPPSNTIGAIEQDSSGRLWIATDKGLLIYNPIDDNFWRFNHSVTNPFSLKSDYILTFFEDKEQMIWIGTFAGVDRWNPKMTTFNQYNAQKHPSLKSNNISAFAQSTEHIVYFSTYNGGLYQLDTRTNKIDALAISEKFANYRIMSLLSDKQTLWVGTRSSGLFNVDLNEKSIVRFQHQAKNPQSISANSITDILKDHQGTIWVSTYHNGLNRLNDDGSFTRYVATSPASNKGPSTNHVLQIIEDKQGVIWLAAYGGGINRFDPLTETFMHIQHVDGDITSLSSDLAWVLYLDSHENLWVGTQAAGINILKKQEIDSQSFTFEHLNSKDGMKSQTAYGINEDKQGNIWFSSNKGISQYSPKAKRFKHYDTSHGLRDLEYNHGVVFASFDKTLYFGSAKGFISIHPDSVSEQSKAPVVKLTNIYNLNQAMVFENGLNTLKELTLDYKDQLISFEYVGLNYSSPESTRYRYRLLGSESEWIDAGKQRRATYTNLPQGTYTLQIIAGNSDNVWSDPYELTIVMHPAPWKTWWAYMIYVAIIALALLSYSRFLNRKLAIEQLQKLDLKKQVEEKTQKYLAKNTELELVNKKLEQAATIDKVTGIKSRRYLDIYIEQASQLMNQIHQNLLPVQRNILPRLYILMININDINTVSNSQLVNFTDLLLYTRNHDDLLIRWSDDTFAIIGYEKENNAAELSTRLVNRFNSVFDQTISLNIAYSFYPFNREQPVDISWDQMSVLIEKGLRLINQYPEYSWIGLYEPKEQPFEFIDILQVHTLDALKDKVVLKVG